MQFAITKLRTATFITHNKYLTVVGVPINPRLIKAECFDIIVNTNDCFYSIIITTWNNGFLNGEIPLDGIGFEKFV